LFISYDVYKEGINKRNARNTRWKPKPAKRIEGIHKGREVRCKGNGEKVAERTFRTIKPNAGTWPTAKRKVNEKAIAAIHQKNARPTETTLGGTSIVSEALMRRCAKKEFPQRQKEGPKRKPTPPNDSQNIKGVAKGINEKKEKQSRASISSRRRKERKWTSCCEDKRTGCMGERGSVVEPATTGKKALKKKDCPPLRGKNVVGRERRGAPLPLDVMIKRNPERGRRASS